MKQRGKMNRAYVQYIYIKKKSKLPIYGELESLKERRKWGNRKNIWINGSNVDEDNQLIVSGSWMNSKHKTHEESDPKLCCDQIM